MSRKSNGVIQLYPASREEESLEGLYLRSLAAGVQDRDRTCVYTNFVASMDGRIAVENPKTGKHHVPRTIANPRDWRLYQELAAYADVLLVSGRYIRQFAVGKVQAGLPLGDEDEYADLRAWRTQQGLAPQPAVVVVSRSLELPMDAIAGLAGRQVFVVTVRDSDPGRLREVRAGGVGILFAGNGDYVEGRQMIAAIEAAGFHKIYSVAGPHVLRTLLNAEVLDRLYLTQVHRMIGGDSFDTLLEGRLLASPADFDLRTLYFDRGSDTGLHQSFGIYDYRGSHTPDPGATA